MFSKNVVRFLKESGQENNAPRLLRCESKNAKAVCDWSGEELRRAVKTRLGNLMIINGCLSQFHPLLTLHQAATGWLRRLQPILCFEWRSSLSITQLLFYCGKHV